jgi:NADH:ubiquinone oxidoreductase subunit 5 (subunit L)/multisubunit Na+/H+ antiporter MnhA subunit
MTVPLVILAVFSIGIGGVWHYSDKWFEKRVNSEALVAFEIPESERVPLEHAVAGEPAYTSRALHAVEELHEEVHVSVLGMSLLAFALGVLGAWAFFGPYSPLARKDVLKPGTVTGALLRPLNYCLKNLWFVDALFHKVFVNLVHALRYVCGKFDQVVIDGLVNLQAHICLFIMWVVGIVDYEGVDGTVRGLGNTTLRFGRWFRRLQTGNLQEYVYASVFLAAGVLVVFVVVTRWFMG